MLRPTRISRRSLNPIYQDDENYCAWQYGVKIRLKILIYKYKIRCFAEF